MPRHPYLHNLRGILLCAISAVSAVFLRPVNGNSVAVAPPPRPTALAPLPTPAKNAYYDSCYHSILYKLDSVGTDKALVEADRMREHAKKRNSAYGIRLADILKAHIAKDMQQQSHMNALELEAAKAENENIALQLHHNRMMLVAALIGIGLLTAYLYRRLRGMRQLRQAYRQLEEAYGQLEQVTTQKERIESELRIARNIQMSAVPDKFPSLPGASVYASMTPAKAVGGDLYDFFVRDGQLFFCIGDVSGKGVPAALFMMMTKSLFRVCSSAESRPDSIVTRMNANLSENNRSCMFVTLFVGILHLASGRLRYCCAGHENPIVISSGAAFLPVSRAFPVGIAATTVYQAQETVIKAPATILLFTDGLNEAMNAEEKMMGHERVLSEASRAAREGQTAPEALIRRMEQAVSDFAGDTEQSDDLTMLAVSLLPSE